LDNEEATDTGWKVNGDVCRQQTRQLNAGILAVGLCQIDVGVRKRNRISAAQGRINHVHVAVERHVPRIDVVVISRLFQALIGCVRTGHFISPMAVAALRESGLLGCQFRWLLCLDMWRFG